MKHIKKNRGFTLVEMALVLIVIGLLSAGILKGQELIANSQMTSTIKQIEDLSGAAFTFKSSFGVYAGDMANAQFRLENCTANPCFNGNGDGIINNNIGIANTLTGEGAYFFNHLAVANLIEGLSGENEADFGAAFLGAPIGGGYMIGDKNAGAVTGFQATELADAPYLLVVGNIENVAADTGILYPTQAARIDRTIDDGITDTGSIIAQNAVNSCRDGTDTDQYDEEQIDQVCVIAIRLPDI